MPMIMNPEETRAFVKKQYDIFSELTERLGLSIK